MLLSALFFALATLVVGNADTINNPKLEGPSNETPHWCPCTREYNPLCGSDQVTYSNKCNFQCANNRKEALSIEHTGECDTCKCNDSNTADSPLCGSNGLTYYNRCLFDCAQAIQPSLTIAYNNECGCGCHEEYHPICTVNNQEFYNYCEYECAGEGKEIAVYGPCEL